MLDNDRRGAPPRNYDDWNAALDAVERLAHARATLQAAGPETRVAAIDEAQVERAIAEIRRAASRLETCPDADDTDPYRRRRRIAWLAFGAVWIVTALMTAGSITAILLILT